MLDKINDRLDAYEKKIESLTQTVSDLQIENKNLRIKNFFYIKRFLLYKKICNKNSSSLHIL